MRPGGSISIWFFIGISLLFNGLLILGSGIYEYLYPPAEQLVLYQYHAAIWWGGLLSLLGALYCYFYLPGRTQA